MSGEHDALARYVDDFAAQRFFQAHEDLEGLWWQKESDPLIQGLILLAAAFVQCQRGKTAGAMRHLQAVHDYLRTYPPGAASGVPVAEVLAYVGRSQAILASGVDATEVPALMGPLPWQFAPGALTATPPPPQDSTSLNRAIQESIQERIAAGKPVGPTSWAPVCRETLRKMAGTVARDEVRAAVRQALQRTCAR